MLSMSAYGWLLTKNQRKEHSYIKFLTISELGNKSANQQQP